MRKNVWRIVLSYALVASLWIFFSDQALVRLGADPQTLLRFSILKGLLFVVITAGLLYLLISRLATRLLQTGHAKEASEKKFRTLFERIRDGLIVVNVETMRVFMGNHALLEMLGYSSEELAGLHIRTLHPPEYQAILRERFDLLRKGTLPPRKILPIRRKDGSIFLAEISSGLIELEGQRYTISLFRDMTEILQAQENLKRTRDEAEQAKEEAEKANHAKDRFIAILSHELRTPLTPALAIANALRETLPEPARADAEVIRRNLELETRLIDDLLDITRITQGKITLQPEPTDLHDAVRNALDICQASLREKQIGRTVRLEAAHSLVSGDPPRLQQIFWNLIANAIKFTPEGGSITLRSANFGNTIRVEIADTGIGIDPGELPRIFLPFEQGDPTRDRRFGGLGLGLSIAQNIARLHGGTLTGSSEGPGRGSTFAVELPLMETEGTTTPPAAAAAPASKAPLPRILLVDDHADTLQILARLLRRCHYETGTAASVRKALERARKEHFDILVSDLALPDGSGLDIMETLKASQGIRGIALSGYGTDEDRQKSRAAGFEEHLVKPISFPALRSALERMTAAPPKPGPDPRH